MKKLLSLLLAAFMVFSLVACASNDTPEEPEEPSGQDETPESPDNTTENETPEEPESDAPSNKATLGDFDVEIKSASLSEDYEGNPVIIVTYSWTNNSDDTTSPMISIMTSAFQDGVGLETAIISDDESFDSNSYMTDVRPGTTIDVQEAFVLSNTTSEVEIEIEEFLSLDSDPPVAYMVFDPSTL